MGHCFIKNEFILVDFLNNCKFLLRFSAFTYFRHEAFSCSKFSLFMAEEKGIVCFSFFSFFLSQLFVCLTGSKI